MAETMLAVGIKNSRGPASSLFHDRIPKPVPSAGEALVAIKAFGLNRMDLMQREGHYPVPAGAPSTLGVEFSGVIQLLGPEKEGFEDKKEAFKEGDEVFGLAYGGAYAEFIAVSTHMLIHKPKGLGWVEAAGIPETWITATQALHLVGCFTPGKSVLWHAGASAVSISGIQLSKLAGASQVFVTAGSQEKIDFCVSTLGGTAGFNYKTQNWSQEIMAATNGKGVDIIIDFVGPSYFQGNLDTAAVDGKIVNLGFLSGTKLQAGVDIAKFVTRRIRFEGSSLRSRDLTYQGRLRDKLDEYLGDFESGKLRIFVDKVFKWEDVVKAHEYMEKDASMGKIICTIGEI
ncbi:hypothetical protein HYALB_00013803 [Hymenoscyphus albidus]|uniref:Enoyl reductase (ER) domain-containing protein n=1 Tax=Hymenoscyphus albidus TaxID=595503 RepID=A0A9N9LYF4_9HELO|nr:hypothetical protein HYALB_00013803 [Hymenoscyphus albidus]